MLQRSYVEKPRKILLKKNGKTRVIYDPPIELKAKLQRINEILQRKLARQPGFEFLHGFIPGRSPVTNAQAHIGYRYTLCVDLKDFFGSVRRSHVANLVRAPLLDLCFLGDLLPQGFPSSPVIANLAFLEADRKLSKATPVYTRYADDLSFSSDCIEELRELPPKIVAVIAPLGFALHPKKTSLQYCDSGVARKKITGVCVGMDDIHVPRETKRRMRAASQNRGLYSRKEKKGLRSWIKSIQSHQDRS